MWFEPACAAGALTADSALSCQGVPPFWGEESLFNEPQNGGSCRPVRMCQVGPV